MSTNRTLRPTGGTGASRRRAGVVPVMALLAALLTALLAACGVQPVERGLLPQPEFAPVQSVSPSVDPFVRDTGDTLRAEAPSIWFVEIDALATLDGGSVQTLADDALDVRRAAAAAGIDLETRYTFSTFITGFSARVAPEDVGALERLPGVRRVLPVSVVDAPEPTIEARGLVEPRLATALDLTGARFVQDELGFDGSDVRVGIIDTGIMLTHPAFSGRIVAGFDFVGDFYDASDPATAVPQPEPSPGSRPGGGDCNGHGTHVAGIVAADDARGMGVAPNALLGAYRVFGCAGSSHSDVILAALERAFADGMDVVNLSLGSNNGWPQDFLSIALGRMLEVGVVPVASAGNNGASGIYTVGSPGAGADVITVASFDNTTQALDVMEVNGTTVPFTELTGAPAAPTEGTTPPIVYIGQGCATDAYLDDPTGFVALITRGACPFAEKYDRAYAEGAVGVIIENNEPGIFSGTLGGPREDGFGIAISGTDGTFIKSLISAGAEPAITWTGETTLVQNPTGGLISTFSSYGLAPDLSLKPDLGAPGGFINAPYIVNATPGQPGSGTATYAVLSGTSMSSPHVAGAVALLLQARPDVPRDRIRDALMNTAWPMPWNLNPGLGFPDSVHRQGAGMIDIAEAIATRTYALPASLALGESASGTYVDVITLHNDTDAPIVYALTQLDAFGLSPVATVGASDAPGFALAPPLVEYFALQQSTQFVPIDAVTVPAGGLASFRVRVTANPAASASTIYGTYLAFLPIGATDGAAPILVPAAGFVGDYQQLPLYWLDPFLALVDGTSVFLLPEGWTFTMRDGDVPTFGVGMQHAAQVLSVDVVPLADRAWIGPQLGLEAELVRRNNPGTVSIFGLGDLDASQLPSGEYKLRVTALKALGDPTNPAHVVVRETPRFFINRFAPN